MDKAAKTPGTPFALGLSSGSTNHVLIHTTLRIHTHRTGKHVATAEFVYKYRDLSPVTGKRDHHIYIDAVTRGRTTVHTI